MALKEIKKWGKGFFWQQVLAKLPDFISPSLSHFYI